jgi:hypothetical protein
MHTPTVGRSLKIELQSFEAMVFFILLQRRGYTTHELKAGCKKDFLLHGRYLKAWYPQSYPIVNYTLVVEICQ